MKRKTSKSLVASLLIGGSVIAGILLYFTPERIVITGESIRGAFIIKEAPPALFSFAFDSEDALQGWDEKVFHGKTKYRIVGVGGEEPYLNAQSEATSSALYHKVHVDLKRDPHLVWEWKALSFPSKEDHVDLGSKSENDFAARVYVIFEGGTVFTSEVIQYIWDDRFPEGKVADSGFSSNIKMLVIQSGTAEGDSEWVLEDRNLAQDYRRLFGKEPKKRLGAVAFMSDSDNTKTQSEANVRYFKIVIPKSKGEK